MILHDLAADWSWMDDGTLGFVIGQGTVVWETAAYAGDTIRVERLDPPVGRRVQYLSPDTPVTLVTSGGVDTHADRG